MKLRRPLVVLTALAVVGASAATAAGAAPAASPSPTYRADDYADGQAMSVLPPGANGITSLTDALAYGASMGTGAVTGSGTTYPAHSQDQVGPYDHLAYAGTGGNPPITDATLGSYYGDESFGVQPGDVTKTVANPGGQDVTIYYDGRDIPHVYGSDDDTMAFGAGYAQASERLFLMDVLRHYGEGQTAAFVGSSCADFAMDHDQLLLAPYTPAEAQAQVDALPQEYGVKGARTRAMIYAFVNGINAYIDQADQNPTTMIPVEYYALPTASSLLPTGGIDPTKAPLLPTHWTVGDVVAIAGLIGGIFGKGGGNEVNDAALYEYLVAKLGTAEGQQAYAAFKSQNDPDAPSTIVDQSFPYLPSLTAPTAKNVLPAVGSDGLVHLTSGTDEYPQGSSCDSSTGGGIALPAAVPAATSSSAASTPSSLQTELLGDVGALATLPQAFSNALVVDAKDSADGHPIAVFGPQVSYFAPQILMQEDLHSPTYAASGVSFPGTGVVELGRGEDFAWSATSAGTDLIDQRLLYTCGGDQHHYLVDGVCTAFVSSEFDELGTPTAGGLGAPGQVNHTVYRTADKQSVVQGWTTDATGKQVAVVTERSTYNHDVDSVVGFVDWGTPSETHDVTSWMHGATEIGFTFNWFYVDDRDTGYYVSGLDPVRPSDVDTNLPQSGNTDAAWQGYLTPDQHPHEVNPAQGFFVSWNNKPAPGFSAADEQFGYGSTYRSAMLVTQLQGQLAAHGGKVTRADVVQAMITAATQDLDGLTEVSAFLAYLQAHPDPNETPTEQQVVDLLTTWVQTGAHRHKAQESDTQYAQAAAVATADELVPNLVQAIWSPLLTGANGAAPGISGVGNTGGAADPGFAILPMQWTNTPHSGGANLGSAYDGGWEGYVHDTFAQLGGRTTGDMFDSAVTSTWCGGGPASCPTALWTALQKTVAAMTAANPGAAPADWLYDTDTAAVPASPTNPTGTAATPMPVWDAIHFRAIGLVATPPVDWQNRPTFQQVVEFPRHRDRTAGGTAGTAGTTTTARGGGSLAVTGGLPGALAGLLLVAVGGALTVVRRRRA